MAVQAETGQPNWYIEQADRLEALCRRVPVPRVCRPFVLFPVRVFGRMLCILSAFLGLVCLAAYGGVGESFAIQRRLHLSIYTAREAIERLADKERHLNEQTSLTSAILQETEDVPADKRSLFLASLRNLSIRHHSVLQLQLGQLKAVKAHLNKLREEHEAVSGPSFEDQVLHRCRHALRLALLERQEAIYWERMTFVLFFLFVVSVLGGVVPSKTSEIANAIFAFASFGEPSFEEFARIRFAGRAPPTEEEILSKRPFAEYLSVLKQHHALGLFRPTDRLLQPFLNLVGAERDYDEAEERVQAAVLDAVIVRSEVKRLFKLARREKED